ncbi:enoyl-CoA hydratase/isomerase family protein [Methylibium petroleiphilum]|uniref:Methylglutaconyl-CoA hydratase n=1 Tax=Methylibium petroleiphilum (strain ATCC BAA-1232 / LMG 22953 / PM1) TaxID=420662 RepID=A2SL72_METPP|nr:enoyl-CoA hydratase/isomerase family protein [Methylibium petroleiphilum]ABM96311.1 methylglutaconyl-CoA hydratase [Methylibium petroleiphilum PM1]
MSADTTVRLSRPSAAVARVTLCRPDVRNAFNDEIITALTQAFRALDADDTVRVVVLAAEGPAFCAGADLHWMRRMADYTRAQNLDDAAGLAQMLRSIAGCRKPTIARVQGDAYAGGVGLVAACDLAVAVDTAQFCLSEVKLGLVPATIGPYVVRAMGPRAAQRYMLTAERFDATTAQRTGLLHEVAPAEALDAAVQALVDALLAASPQALATGKRLLHEITGAPLDAALIARTVEFIADARASDDGREGVQAFLGKRRPRWQA